MTNRTDPRCARFFDSYVDTIIQRDLSTIAQVHDQANVRRLLSAVASMSASLMNFDGLARDLGLSSNTVRSHMALLDTLFLTTRLEAWSTNLLGRVVKAPKAYINDSGLPCHLLGLAQKPRTCGDLSFRGGRVRLCWAWVTRARRHWCVAADRRRAAPRHARCLDKSAIHSGVVVRARESP